MLYPNSFEEELQDSQKDNPEIFNQGTEEVGTLNPLENAKTLIYYQKKISASSREALRLLEENKLKDAEIARLKTETGDLKETENLYPGFEELDQEAQQNLISYTDMITKRATDQILNDPAIIFARNSFNERKFDNALDIVIQQYPELKDNREEFKNRYFKVNNVPENIKDILEDVTKIYLFDKAKNIGAEEEKTKVNRIELERTKGGDKEPKASRTLSDWQRMAQENPAKFAQLSKEYNSDLNSGKLKE